MSSIKKTPYDIVRRPRITEKSAALASTGERVVFEVHPRANKLEIKNAVEKLFDVKVEAVRTINSMGKVKRVRLDSGRQAAWKKAYVTLKAGSSINVIEGL